MTRTDRYPARMPIDLRSDTVTKPTPAMRQAMANAEVGDDVLDGDPSAQRLEAHVAELLGKERSLFFPTGSMANQAAILLHTRPGTEILLDANAHIIHWEMAAAAALAGVQVRPVAPTAVVMTASDLQGMLRPSSPHAPRTSLVCVENTHNGAGGKVTPLDELHSIERVARGAGLPVHMDGARLWNAAAAGPHTLAELASVTDTVMVSFSKGLGAPAGAALAGSAAAIAEARVIRKRLGGGMRQVGVLAAAAQHGVEHHRARLVDDHARARRLADRVEGAGGARVVPPDTNIVMIDLPRPTAGEVVARLAEEGILISGWHERRVRIVTHLDASDADVDHVAERVAVVLEAA